MNICEGVAEFNWDAFASFLTAGAAWTVAYLTYRIARGYWKTNRQLEVLKLREKWVSNLREAMSEYIAAGIVNDKSPDSRRRFLSLHSKILLMMNPEKSDKFSEVQEEISPYTVSFKEIQNKMNAVGEKWTKSKSVQSDMAALQIMFHKYLKLNWDELQKESGLE